MKSIYKNDEGRATMARWYERFVAKIPEKVEFLRVPTRFGETNVLVAGPEDAPPLWCFHGAMASAPAALYQAPAFLERFRVFFPDTVGQPGRSDETRLDWQGEEHGHWVLDILDAMELQSVNALGVSLGGYVVLRAAALAPERIARAGLWVPGGLVKPSVANMFGLIGDSLMYSLFPTRRRLERVLARTMTELDDTFIEFFADSLKHVHPDRRFPSLVDPDALARWDAPVMLVTHAGDTLFPAERLLARARAVIPNLARVETVPNWAHMPPFARDSLAPTIDAFSDFLTPVGDEGSLDERPAAIDPS